MPEPAILAEDLHKSYGPLTALAGLSLSVPAGSVTGLLGRNGSGKTTTVSILATALRADRGRARVCGLEVGSEAAAVRRMIGFAGQFATVDPNLTGLENLVLIGRLCCLGRRLARRRAEELLDGFGLADAGGRLVRTYSGGMRRRLDLAAALVHRPAVDGTPLAGRAQQLVALELRPDAQEHRPQGRASARAVRPDCRLSSHGEADRLPKALDAGGISYPLSLLAGI